MYSTHLPSQDAERIHVTGHRRFGIGQPEALRVNQFWCGTVEEPIDACPWGSGWNRNCSKASNPDTPVGVDEDVRLEERHVSSLLISSFTFMYGLYLPYGRGSMGPDQATVG